VAEDVAHDTVVVRLTRTILTGKDERSVCDLQQLEVDADAGLLEHLHNAGDAPRLKQARAVRPQGHRRPAAAKGNSAGCWKPRTASRD
jgi:hypothetical protein